MAPTEEGLTDLEESISKMVKKAMERAMDAMRHSFAEWVKESQTKAAEKMGLQLLPNGDKGEESTHSNSKETYSNVSKLLPQAEMPALQVFDENSERIFVQKTPTSISQSTNPIICSPNPYWNALKTHCNRVVVYKLHENEYGKFDGKFENANSLMFLFESMFLIDISHTIMESNGNRRGGGSFVSISPSQTPKSSEKAMRDLRSEGGNSSFKHDIRDSKGVNVQVIVRCRPLSDYEIKFVNVVEKPDFASLDNENGGDEESVVSIPFVKTQMKKISEDVGKLDKGYKGTVMEADFAESKMQSFHVTVNDKLDGNLDKHRLNSMGILTPLVGLNEIGQGFGSRSAERVVGRRLDGNGYGRGGSGGGPGNSRYRKQDMPGFEGVNLNGQRSRNYKFRLAKDEIAGNGKEISHTPLTLVVKKNSVPDLTMIDLPCNTMILVQGQPEDIYKQISDITVEFISTGESIILNVFFTTVEFPICESIRMSQLVDKTGERTLAAVTKPDKDPDWLHENVITDDGKIGLGYACVRNRIGVHWLCLCEEDSSHKFVEEFLVAEIEVLEETKAIALPECLPRLAFQALLQLNLTLQFPSFNLEDKVVFGGGVM